MEGASGRPPPSGKRLSHNAKWLTSEFRARGQAAEALSPAVPSWRREAPPVFVTDSEERSSLGTLRAGIAEPQALLASLRGICEAHPGPTPLFVHVLLDEQEVVVRAKGLSVLADEVLLGKVEGVLGPGSILVEYAGRA